MPLDYTEYDTRLAAYAVCVQERDGAPHVLLALWNETAEPRWSLPGGGVELDETPEQGAVREVQEEAGYDVVLDGLLGVHTRVIPPRDRLSGSPRPLRAVMVIYAATIVGGELRPEVGGTTDECRWWPLADVAQLPRVSTVDAALRFWRAGDRG
ncbi:NUDIX hydrolase [Nocardioides sp. R-C-SC26]|uniref:NUDIX hydrolase n=1 Tax=Nocardioides sp. R-C-SC26 TaxID=2870414 RepID=UPI001E41D8DF|nr:NUDIX domain-containing protein [Nocardioides sp. R-C-SC26]